MPISNGERPGGVFRGMPSWRRLSTSSSRSPASVGWPLPPELAIPFPPSGPAGIHQIATFAPFEVVPKSCHLLL